VASTVKSVTSAYVPGGSSSSVNGSRSSIATNPIPPGHSRRRKYGLLRAGNAHEGCAVRGRHHLAGTKARLQGSLEVLQFHNASVQSNGIAVLTLSDDDRHALVGAPRRQFRTRCEDGSNRRPRQTRSFSASPAGYCLRKRASVAGAWRW
jgi:hypothetical protein